MLFLLGIVLNVTAYFGSQSLFTRLGIIFFRVFVVFLLVGSVFHLKRSIEATNCLKHKNGLVYLHLATFTTQIVIFAVQILINYVLRDQAIELNRIGRHSPEGIEIRIYIE